MELNFETISFQIISFAGEAKGFAMNAIKLAKEKKFDEANKSLDDAEQSMIKAEKSHMDVVVAEANGEKFNIPVLFIHAEDQLLSTQTIMLLAKEFVDLYKELNELKK